MAASFNCLHWKGSIVFFKLFAEWNYRVISRNSTYLKMESFVIIVTVNYCCNAFHVKCLLPCQDMPLQFRISNCWSDLLVSLLNRNRYFPTCIWNKLFKSGLSKFLKAAFHKFYLVYSGILCPISYLMLEVV